MYYLQDYVMIMSTVKQLVTSSQSNSLIEQQQMLSWTKYNEYVIIGFTHKEITQLNREMACH